jgi:hypothetical protein
MVRGGHILTMMLGGETHPRMDEMVSFSGVGGAMVSGRRRERWGSG